MVQKSNLPAKREFLNVSSIKAPMRFREIPVKKLKVPTFNSNNLEERRDTLGAHSQNLGANDIIETLVEPGTPKSILRDSVSVDGGDNIQVPVQ